MNFERNKDPIVAMGAGLSDTAFHITEFWVTVLEIQEPEPPYEPPLGRYFRNDNQRDYEVGKSGHILLKAAIKKDQKKIKEILGSFLKNYARNISLHFGFFFKGYVGPKFTGEFKLTNPDGKVFFRDLEGCLVELNGALIEIPEERLIRNSDFQIYLKGTKEPNFE